MKMVTKIMGLKLKAVVLMILSLLAIKMEAQSEQDKILPIVILKDHTGGNIEGGVWDSSELINKVNLILYVAPSQQNEAESLLQRVDEQSYPNEAFKTTIIINTSATWLPNSIIEGKVKNKAEKDTTKTYVLDLNETLLNKWDLSEDNPNVILFDEIGEVSFISKEKINEKIEDNLLHQITLHMESKINEGVKE